MPVIRGYMPTTRKALSNVRTSSVATVYVMNLTAIDPARLASARSVWRSVLAHSEVCRAGRYARREDADRFMAGRALLRIALGNVVGVKAEELGLAENADGRPVIEVHSEGTLHFSVSHGGGLVMVALAHQPVGVDVEPVAGPPSHGLVTRVCSAAESNFLASLCETDRGRAFTQLWSRKEALCKASHGKLSMSCASTVDTLSRSLPGAPEGRRWRLRDLSDQLPCDYAAALASAGRLRHRLVRTATDLGRMPGSGRA
jgi:4'-phosphopantetheinyl transferase